MNRAFTIKATTSNRLVCGAIFIVTCTLFLLSKVSQISDSRYSMLVSQSLLDRGSVDLDHYVIPGIYPLQPAGLGGRGYQLELVNRHLYYYFPIGSSLLSLPYVAVLQRVGISAVNPDGTYNPKRENRIQLTLAAILMASLACLIFLTARFVLPMRWSIVTAFGCALGTQMWSTASRALWSDTWGIALLGLVVYILLEQETRGQRTRPALLASLLAWGYFVRPTNSLPILGVTGYLFFIHRSLFVRYVLTGAAWMAGFITYSLYHFGQILPNYYLADRLTFESFWTTLPANLISPSRGLFVFVPVLLFVANLLIRYRGDLESPRLVALALGIIAAHIIVVSGFPRWWGGHSYGPRLTTGLVPWFALLGIIALRARLTWQQRNSSELMSRRARRENTLGGALLLLSVAIHMNGALNMRTLSWNIRPVNVDVKPARVWDWSDPQFLAR